MGGVTALIAVLLLVGIYFLSYNFTHAAGSVVVNINNGAATLEIAKGDSATFELTTTTTSTSALGYTLSAFIRTAEGDITLEKCNNELCTDTTSLSSVATAPTEIETTEGPLDDDQITTTKYKATVASDAIDGPYSITIAYYLAENKHPDTFANFTADYCLNKVKANEIVTLTDERNNQQYRVKKMPDNHCWMIDNLKYLPTTNYPNGQQIAQVASGKYMTVDGTSTQSTANSDKAFYANPAGTTYCDTTVYTQNSASKTGCGYLYSWYAATNGTGTYALSSGEASGSICPANFRLPTGGDTGEFAYLNAYMAGVTPPSTSDSYYANWHPAGSWQGVFSGYWLNGLNYQSSNGYFWSSTVNSSSYPYRMVFYPSSVSPASYNSKSYGFAVRCVAS